MPDIFDAIGQEVAAANEKDLPEPPKGSDPMAGVDLNEALLSTEDTNVAAGLTYGDEPTPRDPALIARQAELVAQVETEQMSEKGLQDLGRRTISAVEARRLLELGHEWVGEDAVDIHDHQSNIIVATQVGQRLRQSESSAQDFAWHYALLANNFDPLDFDSDEHDPEDMLPVIEMADRLLEAGRVQAVSDAEQDLETTRAEYEQGLNAQREQAIVSFFGQVKDSAKREQAVDMVLGAAAAMHGGDMDAALDEIMTFSPEEIGGVLETLASALAAEKQAQFRSAFENMLRSSGETNVTKGISMNGVPAEGVDYLHEPVVNYSDLEAVIPDTTFDMTPERLHAALTGDQKKTTILDWAGKAVERGRKAEAAKLAAGRRGLA